MPCSPPGLPLFSQAARGEYPSSTHATATSTAGLLVGAMLGHNQPGLPARRALWCEQQGCKALASVLHAHPTRPQHVRACPPHGATHCERRATVCTLAGLRSAHSLQSSWMIPSSPRDGHMDGRTGGHVVSRDRGEKGWRADGGRTGHLRKAGGAPRGDRCEMCANLEAHLPLFLRRYRG